MSWTDRNTCVLFGDAAGAAVVGAGADAAIAQLGGSRRTVVRMHLAGYHRREIAELLGWTEAKTRNLLYRGLSDLRNNLQERD